MSEFLVGEKVIMKNSLSHCLIIETKNDQILVQTEDGLKQWVSSDGVFRMLLETEDGLKQWVSTDGVFRMLLEIDPKPSSMDHLNELWDMD